MRLAALGAAGLAALAAAGCGQSGAPRAATAGAPAASATVAAAAHPFAAGSTAAPAAAPRLAPGQDEVVRPRRRLALRAGPAGARVAAVGPRTEFGSPRWLLVRARRGGWLGVVAPERPNGRLGWLPASDVWVRSVDVHLVVDLSQRTLRVVRDGRVVERMRVGVGAPATPTPTGRFAVTDGLLTGGAASPYGCCILALSGHQPHIAQGWTGGDRIAIHGTDDPASVGAAVSHGCLRAREDDIRRLLRVARLGAPVVIRS